MERKMGIILLLLFLATGVMADNHTSNDTSGEGLVPGPENTSQESLNEEVAEPPLVEESISTTEGQANQETRVATQPTLSKTANFYLAIWVGLGGLLLLLFFIFLFFKKPKDPWKKEQAKNTKSPIPAQNQQINNSAQSNVPNALGKPRRK